MANGEQEAKARAEQANTEAEVAQTAHNAAQAKAAAEQANLEAVQAETRAAQAEAEAKKASDEAEAQPGDEAKKTAARTAKNKAEEAKAAGKQARDKAEDLKKEADQAAAKADQAKAKAKPTIVKAGQSTSPIGKGFRDYVREGVAKTGKYLPMTLLLISALFLIMIAVSLYTGSLLDQLSKPEVTRGFITFIIGFGTIAIAIMLVIAAFLSDGDDDKNPLKDRFEMAKGVLTALIGILGTIVGFYFGSAIPAVEVQPLKVANVQANKAPKANDKFTLSFEVRGGRPSYGYTVIFPANTINPVGGTSLDGKVSAEITVPDLPPATKFTPITIAVIDRDNRSTQDVTTDLKVEDKAKAGGGLKVDDTMVEDRDLKPNGKFKLSFQVTGGKAPYHFTVKFPPQTMIAERQGDTNADGRASEVITIPTGIQENTALTPIDIAVKDNEQKTGTHKMTDSSLVIKAPTVAPAPPSQTGS